MEGGSGRRPHPSGARTRVAFSTAGSPWGEAAPGLQPESPASLRGRVGSADGERAAARAASGFPSLFPVLCPSAVTLSGEENEKAREAPQRRPQQSSPLGMGAHRPRPTLPT